MLMADIDLTDDDVLACHCRRCRRRLDDVDDGPCCRPCTALVASMADDVRRLRISAARLTQQAARLPLGLGRAAYLIAAARLVAEAEQLGRQLPAADDDDGLPLPATRTASADRELLRVLAAKAQPFGVTAVVDDASVRQALTNCLVEPTQLGLAGLLREGAKRPGEFIVTHDGDGRWRVAAASMPCQPTVDAA